jgi:hypothetical protein
VNNHIIITPDDTAYKSESFTAFGYNLDTKELIFSLSKNLELISDEKKCIGRSPFRPFGLTVNDSILYVASNDKIGMYDLASLQFQGTVDLPLYVNTHQILNSKGTLYTTNTSNDTIGIHDLSNNVSKFFSVRDLLIHSKVSAPWSAYSHDLFHVNSLYQHDDKIYFCLHNRGVSESSFWYFDTNTFESALVYKAGLCAHGIIVVDNIIYSLSSATGEVIVYDIKDQTLRMIPFVDPNKTFLRGIGLYNNKLVIGCSNNHKSNKIIYNNNCYISLMDLTSFEIYKYMMLPDLFVISDILIV